MQLNHSSVNIPEYYRSLSLVQVPFSKQQKTLLLLSGLHWSPLHASVWPTLAYIADGAPSNCLHSWYGRKWPIITCRLPQDTAHCRWFASLATACVEAHNWYGLYC